MSKNKATEATKLGALQYCEERQLWKPEASNTSSVECVWLPFVTTGGYLLHEKDSVEHKMKVKIISLFM